LLIGTRRTVHVVVLRDQPRNGTRNDKVSAHSQHIDGHGDQPHEQPYDEQPDERNPELTDILEDRESQPPRGHVRVVYLGPVAPHWEVQSDYGDESLVEQFRERTLARLTLLPPHDPQFRRNRERVVRDAERENLELEWDLGVPEEPEMGGDSLEADA